MPIRVEINITGHLRDLYPHLGVVEIVESDSPLSVTEIIERLGISSGMVLFVTQEERIIGKKDLIDKDCKLNLISPPAGG